MRVFLSSFVNELHMVGKFILVNSIKTLVWVVNCLLKNGKMFIFAGEKFLVLNKIPMFASDKHKQENKQ